MSDDNLELCVWKECATNQRKTELEAGLTSKGTQHYEKVGCYACNGQNTKCLAYTKQEKQKC